MSVNVSLRMYMNVRPNTRTDPCRGCQVHSFVSRSSPASWTCQSRAPVVPVLSTQHPGTSPDKDLSAGPLSPTQSSISQQLHILCQTNNTQPIPPVQCHQQ